MAEKMKSDRSPDDRRAKMYDKSPKMAAEKAKAPEPTKDTAGDAKPAAGESKDEQPAAKPEHPLKAMRTRHETERRDAHNAHKGVLRDMASRHDKEIAEIMDSLQTQGVPNAGSEGAGAEPTMSSGAEGDPEAAAV